MSVYGGCCVCYVIQGWVRPVIIGAVVVVRVRVGVAAWYCSYCCFVFVVLLLGCCVDVLMVWLCCR